MTIAVVIPTLNEASTIVSGLASLARQGADEIVVVDASSLDGTADLAAPHCTRVVSSPRGRGVQQNRGASATSGELLVFLHADCRLEDGALAALRRFARRHPLVPGGCFRMHVDDRDRRFRLIDAAAHLRAGVLGVPYGDQAIFVRREAFARVGGFPEVGLMEDVLLSLRLRRLGRLALLPSRVFVSPRRWHRRGLLRQTLQNWTLTALAALGASPDSLARFYPAIR
jgi:rSAM/selenodomain-associated transferase 2